MEAAAAGDGTGSDDLKAEISDLNRRIKRIEGDTRFHSRANRIDGRGWIWLAWGFALLPLILLVVVFLEAEGFIDFSASIPADGERGIGEFRNLLTMLVPIFAGVIIYIVSATGMKRLQTYDEEFARMRLERREDSRLLREELQSDMRVFRESAREEFENIAREKISDIRKELEERLDKYVQELKLDVDNVRSGYRTEFDKYAREIGVKISELQGGLSEFEKRLENRFGKLLDYPGLATFPEEAVASVGRAHREISRLFAEGKEDEAIAMTLALLKKLEDGTAFGTPDDWFNLSAELGRRDQEWLAFKVCEAALAFYQGDRDWQDYRPNLDLLAHGIQFAGKVAQYDVAEKWIAKARSVGYEKWNWRLFLFVADYFGQIQNEEDRREVFEAALKHFPDDDKVVASHAKDLQIQGKLEQALQALDAWIENYRKKHGRLPKAERSYLLKADMLVELGRYDEAITAADKALADSIGDQPGANVPAIWFYRGAAYDGKLGALLTKASQPLSKQWQEEISKLTKEAVVSYLTVRDHPQHTSPIMMRQAIQRLVDIRARLEIFGLEGLVPDVQENAREKQLELLQAPAAHVEKEQDGD